jgi:hypothetical protein
VHVVAITRLAGDIDWEAKALAVDLGTIPYEQRLKLAGGVPAIVLTTPDPARAHGVLKQIRGRGHDAVAVDADEVVATADMVVPKWLRLDPDALVSTHGAGARVAWTDIAALVRAVQRSHTETTEVVRGKEFSASRAVLTGGLVMKKSVTRELTSYAHDTEPVLYVFARGASVPWCLRERQLRYDALGDAATTSSTANFELMIDAVRVRAPGAAFDARLAARKVSAEQLDLLAHVIARATMVDAPFR